MLRKTILNRIQKHRGFVYGPTRLCEEGATLRLEVEIYPHLRNRPRGSGCGRRGPQYDTLPTRWFEFVPLWGLRVFFLYRMRRVACAPCGGVRVERVPWAEGKHQLTTTDAWFLARWAKRLSWQEVAATFRTSWDSVFRAVAMAVAWGRAPQDLTGIDAVGIDEIQGQHGHRYLTLVYQIDPGHTRLLWIGQTRRVKTLLRFFRWFGRERTQALRFICSDMWQPYLKGVAKKAGHALHVLDRFHIALNMNTAIDTVRRVEVRELKQRGRPAWGVADQDALAVAAAPRQPDSDRPGPPPEPRPPQLEGGAQHVAARRLRPVLALSVGSLGGPVLGPVVHAGDAVAH